VDKYFVSVSPHITAKPNTRSIMVDVLLALMPAVVCSVVFFGFYSLFLIIVSIGGAILGEFLYNLIRKKPQTWKDHSAIVTGLLLALNLPVTVPFFVPLVGSIFAIMVVKMLFGGIGKNFANPAITGRIFLLLAWTSFMTKYVQPLDLNNWGAECFKYFQCTFNGGGESISAFASATPLAIRKDCTLGTNNLLYMFLGYTGGTIGETSVLALLLGGIYLLIKRIIDWKIPTIFIATVALFSLIFGGYTEILPNLLGGGLFLGAIYMATDYATSPNTKIGVCIYAFGCGFLTVLIRYFGNYPEGVSFAILLMNIVTPLLDKYIVPKPFGYHRPEKKKEGEQ